jgi:two-component system phosphate regulon response regulator PhoB
MANHVLIVEDDTTASAVMADVLQAAGYEVTETASGFGVTALVRRLSPAAVLLDLGLPYRPGTSVLADLKTDPRTADVPVVVLSGLTEALSDERRAMAAAVLPKPIDMYELLETVESALAA